MEAIANALEPRLRGGRSVYQAGFSRLCDMVFIKGAFLLVIADPSVEELALWTAWFIITGTLRLVSLLCRDRFEWVRAPAAPAPPWCVAAALYANR